MPKKPRIRLSKTKPFRFGIGRRGRRIGVVLLALLAAGVWVVNNPASYEKILTPQGESAAVQGEGNATNGSGLSDGNAASADGEAQGRLATEVLGELEVKGRAPKTGYSREEFYSTWPTVDGCSLRQRIIKRELGETAVLNECDVIAGEFREPYTGEMKTFSSKEQISKGIQIDHVVALSDAWQKGAQYMSAETRYAMATDPLNLLAVDASANQQKSDGDAATWLPANKAFRCEYVARQIAVKFKYGMWVTEAEKGAMERVLEGCPNERTIGI